MSDHNQYEFEFHGKKIKAEITQEAIDGLKAQGINVKKEIKSGILAALDEDHK